MPPKNNNSRHSAVSQRTLICAGLIFIAICAVPAINMRLKKDNPVYYRWTGQGKADIKYFLVGRRWSVNWKSNSRSFYLEVFDINDNSIVNSANCKNPASGLIDVVSEPGPAYIRVLIADEAKWEIVVKNKR